MTKKGTGTFYKPWAVRIFKLYGKYGIMTYETDSGEIKGIVKLENSPIKSIPDNDAGGKAFTMRIMIRKMNSNYEVDSKVLE